MSKNSGRGLLRVQLEPESNRPPQQETARSGLDAGEAAEQVLQQYVERLGTGPSINSAPAASYYPQTPDDRWARFLVDVASDLKFDKRQRRAA